MLRKRLIFTLLYSDGFFVQSRNFNMQKVGDINWIQKYYNLKKISSQIDELIIIDISRDKKDLKKFIENLKIVSKNFFIPITAGGGIKDLDIANKLFKNGADKILINSLLYENIEDLKKITDVYGAQSIIAGIDLKYIKKKLKIFYNNGSKQYKKTLDIFLKKIKNFPVGEIFINSIDKDGTGMGLDLNILKYIPKNYPRPIIISGGCGNAIHIEKGLMEKKINAVATANLFNFINDGLKEARLILREKEFNLANWDGIIDKHNIKL
jgi:cyclase